MNTEQLRALCLAAKGWNLDTIKPETDDACCKVGGTIDGEFYEVLILECEDYYRDSDELAEYIIATQPPVVLALLDENERLQSDLEKHRELLLHHLSVIDPLRDKNKRLCGLLREALSFMYPEIALHTVIEQELAP